MIHTEVNGKIAAYLLLLNVTAQIRCAVFELYAAQFGRLQKMPEKHGGATIPDAHLNHIFHPETRQQFEVIQHKLRMLKQGNRFV